MGRVSYEVRHRYEQKTIKSVLVKLHKEYDEDLIERLNSVPSKQGYIKQLIRDDIKRDMAQSK